MKSVTSSLFNSEPCLRLAAVVLSAALPTPASAQAVQPTMRAIVVHQWGGPEVLKYQEAPRPTPAEDEILVRIIAAGVNPVDASICSGRYAKVLGITLPFVPGSDIAGIVEKTGTKVTKFKPGDAVLDIWN
jgi:D-arabinose 1-dehydrogenase-like Zn-dependent alcohol dehydrogenase